MNNDFMPRRPAGQHGQQSPENQNIASQSPTQTLHSPSPQASKRRRKWWPPRMPHGKKEWIITIVTILIIIVALGIAYMVWFKPDAAPATKKKATTTTKPIEKPKPLTSTLTGLVIDDAAINDRPVTGIMIENSPDARPQSGIDQAGIVFEAVAEGGITRFLTLWQDSAPTYVGPVRSVRPYYLQWAQGFDAAIAHVGGSSEALQYIKNTGMKDLDQFANSGAYWRIPSRYAPHNVYTSLPKLWDVEAKKGFGKPDYIGFARNETEVPNKTPTATSIDFNLSGFTYNAHFDYTAATNSYNRSEGGKPHMVVDEAGTQKQLSPKVVIGLVMPKGSNGIYSTYNTIGTGQAFIFQDGVMTPGTWSKPDPRAQFTFTDASGAVIKLNPGQTWLTALGSAGAATYK